MGIKEVHGSEAMLWMVLGGICFGLLESVLRVTVKPYAIRLLKRHNPQMLSKPKELNTTSSVLQSKLVAALHNIIQVPLAVYVLLDPAIREDSLYAVTKASTVMVAISAGYFTYDFAQVLFRIDLEGPQYLVHSSCCLLVFAYGFCTQFLHYYGAAFLLWELSTPFVHLRWFLYKMGMADSKLYVYNALAMIVTFFLCRNVWGGYISYQFWRDTDGELQKHLHTGISANTIWAIRVANVALNLLNAFWFHKMIHGAFLVLVMKRRSSSVHTGKED